MIKRLALILAPALLLGACVPMPLEPAEGGGGSQMGGGGSAPMAPLEGGGGSAPMAPLSGGEGGGGSGY